MGSSSHSPASAPPQPPGRSQKMLMVDRYGIDADGIWLIGGSPKCPTLDHVTNFVAAIKLQRIFDAGSDSDLKREYVVEATADNHKVRFEIPAEEFATMDWPDRFLGSGSLVYPGFQHREHAAAAINVLVLGSKIPRLQATTSVRFPAWNTTEELPILALT